jgi:hypothetical protein
MVVFRRCLALLLLFAASCAAPRGPNAAPRRANTNPRVISTGELRDPVLASMDLLKAIRYLRPNFFNATAPQSFVNADAGQLHYSLDFGPIRPVSELVTLTTAMLVEIRYLDANDAQNRFGLNAHGGPVILLLNNKAP